MRDAMKRFYCTERLKYNDSKNYSKFENIQSANISKMRGQYDSCSIMSRVVGII
jgi:hypothetical protein